MQGRDEQTVAILPLLQRNDLEVLARGLHGLVRPRRERALETRTAEQDHPVLGVKYAVGGAAFEEVFETSGHEG